MIFEMPACTGCRTCEMACSFKHTGEFRPAMAAIKVLDKEDTSGFLISFVERKEGSDIGCVGCKECLEYCPASEDLRQLIIEFIKKAKAKKEVSI